MRVYGQPKLGARLQSANHNTNTASMSYRILFTLLGTGSSGGVPRVGNQWGDCNPDNPKNRRRRCAMLVQKQLQSGEQTSLLVDAGADLREQLLSAGVTALDAVLLTHSHADHIFGLDDLRQLALYLNRSIDVHMDSQTSDIVMRAFGYCFKQAAGSSYPPFCSEVRINHSASSVIHGQAGPLHATPLVVEHGDIHALGFRIGQLAYIPDVKCISDKSVWRQLEGVSILVIDALRHRSHPAHMNLQESLLFIERVNPTRAILTNMHSDLDYDVLLDTLPSGVEPGFDGLTIACDVDDD